MSAVKYWKCEWDVWNERSASVWQAGSDICGNRQFIFFLLLIYRQHNGLATCLSAWVATLWELLANSLPRNKSARRVVKTWATEADWPKQWQQSTTSRWKQVVSIQHDQSWRKGKKWTTSQKKLESWWRRVEGPCEIDALAAKKPISD